jgi:hypothetical protein
MAQGQSPAVIHVDVNLVQVDAVSPIPRTSMSATWQWMDFQVER